MLLSVAPARNVMPEVSPCATMVLRNPRDICPTGTWWRRDIFPRDIPCKAVGIGAGGLRANRTPQRTEQGTRQGECHIDFLSLRVIACPSFEFGLSPNLKL